MLLVTGIGSLFAYGWLVITLQVITPNKIDILEGILTLLYFPILVVLAFAADKGWLFGGSDAENEEGQPLDDQKVEQVSRARRHIEAMQAVTATKRVIVDNTETNEVTVEFESAFCHAFPEDSFTQLAAVRRGK